jgi:hypothetical protein
VAPLYELRRDLGQSLLTKHRVYLDTKFWNIFCDVQHRAVIGGAEYEALSMIRSLVQRGTLACPAEYYVLQELLRQRLPDKRETTAALIDELSGGAMIASADDRVMLEVLRFAQAALRGTIEGAPPIDEVWTRPAFALGHLTPENPGLPDHLHAWAVERTMEELWALSFSAVANAMAAEAFVPMSRESGVARMNAAKRDSRSHFTQFNKLYLAEVRGTLDAFTEAIADVSLYLWNRAGGDVAAVTAADRLDSVKNWKRLYSPRFSWTHIWITSLGSRSR